ncbi:hypothetical protein Tco_0639861 [Tanacetum coccineum]
MTGMTSLRASKTKGDEKFGCIRSGLREIRSHGVVVFNDISNGRGCSYDDVDCCLGDVGVGVKGGIIRLLFRDGGLPVEFLECGFDELINEDGSVKDLIEANPDALEWKTKTTSNYNELYMLFAKDRATGVEPKQLKKGENNDGTRRGYSELMENVLRDHVPTVYLWREIYSQLEFMGVDQDLKVSAFVFLLRSPESTRALLDCPLDMQKSILNEMMGTHN